MADLRSPNVNGHRIELRMDRLLTSGAVARTHRRRTIVSRLTTILRGLPRVIPTLWRM